MNSGDRDAGFVIHATNVLWSLPQRVSSIELPSGAVCVSDIIVDASRADCVDPLARAPIPRGKRPTTTAGHASQFADRTLTCVDCGTEFVFTAGEQVFFHEKEFKNDPKRCKRCSAKHHKRPPRPGQEARVTCAECGVDTTVPFKPRNGKPVFCRVCFMKVKPLPVVANPAFGI